MTQGATFSEQSVCAGPVLRYTDAVGITHTKGMTGLRNVCAAGLVIKRISPRLVLGGVLSFKVYGEVPACGRAPKPAGPLVECIRAVEVPRNALAYLVATREVLAAHSIADAARLFEQRDRTFRLGRRPGNLVNRTEVVASDCITEAARLIKQRHRPVDVARHRLAEREAVPELRA